MKEFRCTAVVVLKILKVANKVCKSRAEVMFRNKTVDIYFCIFGNFKIILEVAKNSITFRAQKESEN